MLYRLILKLRHKAFDKGRRKSSSACLPTVCVGNVTVGGTGKTPHTELLLRMLQEHQGLAVLSRGYGRKSKGYLRVEPEGKAMDYGDEPLQIARKFPDVKVAVDANRLEGCEKLKEEGAKLVVLDDAFQHRKLKADLNIVLVNFSNPVFEDKLLPFGRLRDLPERIFKADIIIVSKCPEDIRPDEKAEFCSGLHLSNYDPSSCEATCPDGHKIQVLFSYITYMEPQMVFPEGDHRYVYAQRVVLMSGIAKDRRLAMHLRPNYTLAREMYFADHHVFSRKDLNKVEKALAKTGASAVITTEKDAQRLRSLSYISGYLKERLIEVPIQACLTNSVEEELLLSALLKVQQSRI